MGNPPTYNIFDEDGKFVESLDMSRYQCRGSKTGEIGEMCGGCVACLLKQAEFYGYTIKEDKEDGQ